MKKTSKFYALLVASFAMVLSACGKSSGTTSQGQKPVDGGGGDSNFHMHKYSREYSYDDEYHWRQCELCEEKTDYERHNFEEEWIEPDYEHAGHVHYICRECGYEKDGDDEGEPLHHNYSSDWFYDDDSGHYKICIDEGYDDLKGPLEAHEFCDWYTVYEPTINSEGLEARYCYKCNYTEERSIDRIEHTHTYEDNYEWNETHHWRRANCGHYDEITDYGEHDYNVEVIEPDFDSSGYSIYTCKVCGKNFIDDYVSPKEHAYSSQWSADDEYHWKQCSDEGFEYLYTDWNSHSFGEWLVDTAPTQNTRGLEYRECEVCHHREEQEIQSFEEQTLEALDFELSDDESSYIITGCISWQLPSILTIPDNYEDKPISRIGNTAFNYCSELEAVIFGANIKSVGQYAFNYCNKLTSVTFNEGLEEIEDDAFYCHRLTSITLPSTVKRVGHWAFFEDQNYSDTSVEIINLNEGLESIGSYAFSTNKPIAKLVVPSTVTEFYDSSISAKEITYKAVNATYMNYSYSIIASCETLIIDDNVVHIPDRLCCDKTLKTIIIGASVTEIEEYSFYNVHVNEVVNHSTLAIIKGSSDYGYVAQYASFVTTIQGEYSVEDNFEIYRNDEAVSLVGYTGSSNVVTIPEGVTHIGYNIINNDKNVYQIIIPSSVTTIEDEAFNNLSNLVSVVNMSSVPFSYAKFYYCSNIIEVVTSLEGSNLDFIGDYVVLGDIVVKYTGNSSGISLPTGYKNIYKNFALDNTSLHSVTIPEGYENIGEGAFAYCSNLASVSFPETLKIIQNTAFANTALTSVYLPDSLEQMHYYTFRYCRSLSEVHLGSGLHSLSQQVFGYCTSLENIVIPDNITEIYKEAFYQSGVKNVTLPSRITLAGVDIFKYCSNLETNVKDNVRYLGNSTNDYYMAVSFIDASEEHLVIDNTCEVWGISFNGYYDTFNINELTLGENLRVVPQYNSIFDSYQTYKIKTLNYNCIDLQWYTNYGDYALFNNNGYSGGYLETVNFGSKVKSIPMQAFNYCSKVTSFSLPNSLEKVGLNAFYNMSGVTPYDNGGDKYYGNEENNYLYLVSIEGNSAYIANSCKIIGQGAARSKTLTDLVIPNGVVQIGGGAFARVTYSGGNIVIPDSVKYIESNAFSDLTLTHSTDKTIILNYNVQELADYAFAGVSCDYIELTFNGGRFQSYYNHTALVDNETKTLIVTTNKMAELYPEITFGNEIETIGGYAFSRSTPYIINSDYVKDIGRYAFNYSEMRKVNFGDNLKRIYNYAFNDCSKLTEVILGDNLEEIYSDAFYSCSSLRYIVIPRNTNVYNEAFYYRNRSDSLVMLTPHKQSEKDYGENTGARKVLYGYLESGTENGILYAFGEDDEGKYAYPIDISKATSYTYDPSNVIRDEYHELPASFEQILANKGLRHIVIPEGVTAIPNYAFQNNTNLLSITLPSTCKKIGYSAFTSCWNLSSVTLNEGLETIERAAFMGCTALTSIDIPSSVKVISNSCFYNCSKLASLTLHEGLEEVEAAAFDNTKLTDVSLPETVEMIGISSFPRNAYTIDETGATKLFYMGRGDNPYYFVSAYRTPYSGTLSFDNSVETVVNENTKAVMVSGFSSSYISGGWITLPEGLERVGDYAFNTSGETYVNLPSTVTEIGEHAFTMAHITNENGAITFNKEITSIADQAFSNCSELRSVTFGEGSKLNNIRYNAFYNCPDLESVDMSNCQLCTYIYDSAFENCSSLNNVILPPNLNIISYYAFKNCALTSIIIPLSVTDIYGYVFTGNPEGLTIYCQASEKPRNWSSDWTYSGYSYQFIIVWGYQP